LPNYVDFLHSQEPIRPTVEYSTFTGEQTVQQEVQYNNTEAYYQNYPQEIQYENLVQPREIITREKYTKTIGELVKRQKRQDIELGNIQPTFTQLN
jgi:hypothetical protein